MTLQDDAICFANFSNEIKEVNNMLDCIIDKYQLKKGVIFTSDLGDKDQLSINLSIVLSGEDTPLKLSIYQDWIDIGNIKKSQSYPL